MSLRSGDTCKPIDSQLDCCFTDGALGRTDPKFSFIKHKQELLEAAACRNRVVNGHRHIRETQPADTFRIDKIDDGVYTHVHSGPPRSSQDRRKYLVAETLA